MDNESQIFSLYCDLCFDKSKGNLKVEKSAGYSAKIRITKNYE